MEEIGFGISMLIYAETHFFQSVLICRKWGKTM